MMRHSPSDCSEDGSSGGAIAPSDSDARVGREIQIDKANIDAIGSGDVFGSLLQVALGDGLGIGRLAAIYKNFCQA